MSALIVAWCKASSTSVGLFVHCLLPLLLLPLSLGLGRDAGGASKVDGEQNAWNGGMGGAPSSLGIGTRGWDVWLSAGEVGADTVLDELHTRDESVNNSTML